MKRRWCRHYDHRAADVVTDQSNWVRQGQTEKTSLRQSPESRTFGDAEILGSMTPSSANVEVHHRTFSASRT